jgi:hypothetical protein
VAQRDQVGRALGRHDARDAGDAERVTLGHTVPAEQPDHLGGHEHPAGSHGDPVGDLLGGHVDHPRGPGVVDVGQPGLVDAHQ